jgi:hypothetical protein
VGQNSVSHTSRGQPSPLAQVTLQNASPALSVLLQDVSVMEVAVAVIVEIVVVDRVVVLEPVVRELVEEAVVVVPEEVVCVLVTVSVVVELTWQKPHEKSQICACTHVGQKMVSHSAVMRQQLFRQSSSFSQVVDVSVTVAGVVVTVE